MSERHSHPHNHEHYAMGQLESHLRGWHKDEDPPDAWEAHPHFSTVKARTNDAARIDVHPWAMPRFENAEVVFAVMEGCLKADAVLTSILKHDLNASVYSFPSVTLGNCPELPHFAAKHLKGKTVIAVLDADWADPSKDGAVENQGRIYQGKLLALGVEKVHVSAPPLESGQKGVDDFLGAGKGQLHELVCIDVEPPKNVADWVLDHGGNKQVTMTANVLTSMAVFAGATGIISVTLSCMANAMGVKRESISQVIPRLVSMGAVYVDGILDTGPSFFGGGDDWVKRPSIHILPKELRAVELPHRTLGDVLGAGFFGGQS